MRNWPKAAQVVPGLKEMLKYKFEKASRGIGGWMYGTRDLGAGPVHHSGVDLPTDKGTEVRAMWDGTVEVVDEDDLSGKFVILSHQIDIQQVRVSYCHLDETKVTRGQYVKAGEPVGLTGATGHCFGAHLHLTLRVGKLDMDPMYVLRESCWL